MSAQNAEASEDRLVGTVIQERFLVLERLAAGGMGVVYKAEQVPLGRPVALKILESKQNEEVDSHFSERFFLEAASVAKLGHPNTIILYDYGRTDEGLYYYAMEFVDGETLTRRVHTEGPLPPDTAIHVALQLCGSLREAHAAGMVHRDLKPSNVMLTTKGDDPWFVKVLDFGLVKVMGQDVGLELTRSGMLMGSPRYMAPEQVTGESIDHRVDVYAFGAVLYHALTGGPPFRQGSQYQVLRAQVEEAPAPFHEVHSEHGVPERLEALVMRCLAKAPDDRPASLDEVSAELVACAKEIGVEDISLSGGLRVPPRRSAPDRAAPAAPDAAEDDATSAEVPVAKQVRRDPTGGDPAEPADDPAASDAASDVAAAGATPSSEPADPVEAAPAAPAAAERRGPGLAIVGAVVALLVLAAGGAAYFLGADDAGDDPAASAGAASPPAVETRPDRADAAGDETGSEAPEVPEVPEVPAAGATGSEDPAAEDPAPVRVVSVPEGARVQRGDEDLGDAPVTLQIPAEERWELTLSLDGYEARTVTASAGRGELTVRLSERERRPPRGGRGGAATGETEAAEGSTSDLGSDTTSTDSTGSSSDDDWGGETGTDNRDPWAQ